MTYTMSPELIFIHGFDNLFGSDKVIPLEIIIDDVLARRITLSNNLHWVGNKVRPLLFSTIT